MTIGRSLGTGLTGIADYSTELPFLDKFKSARYWIPQNPRTWNTGEGAQLNLDEQGWVKSLPSSDDGSQYRTVGTVLLREIPNAYRSGRYVVLYEGTGTIKYGFEASQVTAESRPGRDVIQIKEAGGGGIYLHITSTDPNNTGDYVRNIRVYHEEDLPLVELGMQFNPDFTQKIKEFGSLRFMDWMQTNGSQQKEWDDRPTPDSASWAWSNEGVPVEQMVALANETGTAPWFTMPHQATDDYMAQFAAYVRDHLDPSLPVYVEFSNEVWNQLFPQYHYAQEQAEARWGSNPIGGNGGMQWYGMRTAEMSQIWKSTFDQQRDRVIAVASTQGARRGLEEAILNTPAWVAEQSANPESRSARNFIDAYGIAGYFGNSLGAPGNAQQVRSWLSDEDGGFGRAFQQLESGGLLPGGRGDSVAGTLDQFRYHAEVAQRYGKQLVAYEGGQHVVGFLGLENDPQLAEFFIALNRRPEMGRLYDQLLSGWRASDGTLFSNFVAVAQPSKFGSWGALESLTQAGSPKYDALINFMARNDRWWTLPTLSANPELVTQNDSPPSNPEILSQSEPILPTNSQSQENELSLPKLGVYQRGRNTNNRMNGGENDDILLGGEGNDRLLGNNGNDRLHGQQDNDRLIGGTGKDRLIGGLGSDTLVGGGDIDILTGGGGADRFVYATGNSAIASSPTSQLEQVKDFRFAQGDRFVMNNRPRGLFNAGRLMGNSWENSWEEGAIAAYADRNGRKQGSQPLGAGDAVFWKWGDRNFLAIDNGVTGFQMGEDMVIEVTGIRLKANDGSKGVLTVTDYFS